MIDINHLLQSLETIKQQQKALAEEEAFYKAQLLDIMQEEGLEKEEGPYGSVRIQRRYEKNYGDEIKAMEEELKAAKQLKDDLGDYQTMGYKESIVYTLPKALF